MKKIAIIFYLTGLMLFGFISDVRSDWTYIGEYIEPYNVDGNTVTFKCTNAIVKIEVCTVDILRIRMSPSGNFKENEPWVVVKYDWPPVNFQVRDMGNHIALETNFLTVKIHKKPFRLDFFDGDGNLLNRDYDKGSMGWDGEKVICRKQLSETDHFFGLGQRYEESDLRGKKTELWMTENVTPIPFFMATDGYGIFFHNTWKSTFDFTKNPYYFSAPGGGELDYYFIYGPGFKQILHQYTKITGESPLPPKWAFGLFSSKWGKYQQGQEGILKDVRAARGIQDWPLDVIRVHAKNCNQGYWATPKTDWPDDGWGSFPAVDQMVQQLHDMNCLAIFWENPGIPSNCTEIYEEGLDKGYFIMEGDQVWDGRFGFGMDPGALVDFSNPEARKWWAELHNFMIDFDSDGAAGDHGEEVFGTMYSAYSGLTGDEYHNLYSMLYDMATWEAYKARKPNKRSIIFGRSTWAGCQRYPMHGTQDSHSEGKHIYGEIMGCINFGLSGAPFRTFTDNVTRELLEGHDFGITVRYSQHLSLGVAGERTEIMWTGDSIADNNYRFYGKLRYQLIPYIYTYAWKTTQTGLPMVRAMVLEYQDDPKTYSAYCQFLLGEDLLIAPLWSDTTFSREIYLPAGEWIDFWDETRYQGQQDITYAAPIDKVPILVKAGAIIPMAPENQRYMDEKKSPFTIHIYPAGKSSFQLYEDDGVSYDYEKGDYAITTFKCVETDNGITINKNAPKGTYTIPERDHLFCVHKEMSLEIVTKGTEILEHYTKKTEFEQATDGWFYDTKKKHIWVKIKGGSKNAVEISLFE